MQKPAIIRKRNVSQQRRADGQLPEEEDEQRRARHAEDAGAVRAPAEELVGRPTGHQHTHDAGDLEHRHQPAGVRSSLTPLDWLSSVGPQSSTEKRTM